MPARHPRAGRQHGKGPCTDIYLLSVPPGMLTVRAFYEERYRPIRHCRASAETIRKYRTTLNLLDRFSLCDCTIAALSDDFVEEFMAWLLPGRVPKTVNVQRGNLLAIWRHAWRKGEIAELPRDVMEIDEPKQIAEAWSTDELTKMLRAAAVIGGDICGIPAHLYWPALILTLYDTGLRIGALMATPVSAFNAPDRWLFVSHERQKHRADQVIRLHPDTVAAILKTAPPGRELLFPWRWGEWDRHRLLRAELRVILKLAGLPTESSDMFHKFRKTNATYFADATNEREAQRQLGHSSVSVTRRYLDQRKMRNVVHAADVITRPKLPRNKGDVA